MREVYGIGDFRYEYVDGWGTLLWMAAPGSDLATGTGRIFVLAYWVSDPSIRVWHDLPFKSMTGAVMRSRRNSKTSDDRSAGSIVG